MATAKKVPASEFTVHLELSKREAKVLSSVLAKISGNPVSTARKETSAVRHALYDIGIIEYAEYTNADGYISVGSVQE